MSADQLKRAADAIEQSEPVLRVVRADGELTDPDAAVAALLWATGDDGAPHSVGTTTCRAIPGVWERPRCLACLLDDVAAAYLGEEPQP